MRRGLSIVSSIILGCMLAVTGAMARGGGGGGARGGGGFGGGARGGGFAGGGFRGGGFGGGGFRGGAFGGRGFNGFNKFGFNRFGFGFRGFYGGFWPGWGWGWGYPWLAAGWWPGYDSCFDPYSCGYGDPYAAPPAYPYPASPYADASPYGAGYAGYNPAPNVTVINPPPVYAPPAAAQAVIRQYDEYGQEVPPTPAFASPAANAQAPIYLIAFNGSSVIYAAVAYWVDGSTLHYVTLEHQERQAPLSTINRALSFQLNRERRVQFQLPIE
jgi:hypothetical protein